MKIKVADQKIHVNHKRVDVGFVSEKLKSLVIANQIRSRLCHSSLREDVGKVSSVLFPCSAFYMSKSSQDGHKQGSLFSKIKGSPEIAS